MGKQGESRTVFFMNTVYAHDSSAPYGKDPRNPIELPNIPMAYAYLDGLYFEDGTQAVFSRSSTCHTDTGHTMDAYTITREGSSESVCTLYFDCYAGQGRPDVPVGFYMKVGDRKIKHGETSSVGGTARKSIGTASPEKQGCLVPLVAIISVLITIGTVLACTISQ